MQNFNDTTLSHRIKTYLRIDPDDYASITYYNDLLLLIIKNRECWKSPSNYTFNLNIFKPTKKSPIQKQLTEELINELKDYVKEPKHASLG